MNDTPHDLLTAVDDLTEKVAVPMLRGNSHDHDWLELVRPTTPEERLAVKKANAKLPKSERQKVERVVKTGEWWCPWCDRVEAVKPADDVPETINRRVDAPLLEQLEERVGTSRGDGRNRGASSGSSPIDIAAFGLHRRINWTVRDWMKQLGARPGKDIPVVRLLRNWYQLRDASVTPVGEDDVYRLKLEGWRTEILDILDPPEQIPYRGQACPICGQTRAIRTIEGDDEETVALWAFLRPKYREEGSYGICRACDTILARDGDPILLRQKMNGTLATGKIGTVYSTAMRG